MEQREKGDLSVADARSAELLVCFALLVCLHALVMRYVLTPHRSLLLHTWFHVSMLGTAAVWFAWTLRPLGERLARLTIATMVLTTLMQQSTWTAGFVYGYQQPVRFWQNLQSIHWCAGAFLVGYGTMWFGRVRLRPPGNTMVPTPNALRALFVLTLWGALISFALRGDAWRTHVEHLGNGMTAGFVAAALAAGIWQRTWRMRLAIPALALLLIVTLDLTAGRLVGAWRGAPGERFVFVVEFAVCLAVSPLLTFGLLRRQGYELVARKPAA